MRKLSYIFCLFALLQFSCKKSDKNSTSKSSVYTPVCSGTVSFSSNVMPLINSSCNTSGCHSNYSNYNQINANKANIRSRVANGSMPKNATLSNAQKDIILCWIDAGAPNN
jgi:hypothetical protein